jgi:molybdopterin molybdotransferase
MEVRMNAILSCDIGVLPTVPDVLSMLEEGFSPVSGTETVPLIQAFGRVLAQDAKAALTVPASDCSAMDGYAFSFEGQGSLRQVGAVMAGAPLDREIWPDECVAIATGGVVPAGCDTVALREHCADAGGYITVRAKGFGANVRHRGEDFCFGDTLVRAGARLHARHIGLLAAAGIDELSVRRRPNLALVSLGDELLREGPGGVRDANRPMLNALCASMEFSVTDLGTLPDRRCLLVETLAQSASRCDAIILSAGTSAGDEDHVRGAILDCGGELLVSGVAIRPGKPISFGRIGRMRVVALPGNPAAAYVTFLVLARPLLQRLAGRTPASITWQSVTAGFQHRKKVGLREYLRVRLANGPKGSLTAEPCRDNGPATLSSLAAADGLVLLDEGCGGFVPGDEISFAPFSVLETA